MHSEKTTTEQSNDGYIALKDCDAWFYAVFKHFLKERKIEHLGLIIDKNIIVGDLLMGVMNKHYFFDGETTAIRLFSHNSFFYGIVPGVFNDYRPKAHMLSFPDSLVTELRFFLVTNVSEHVVELLSNEARVGITSLPTNRIYIIKRQ